MSKPNMNAKGWLTKNIPNLPKWLRERDQGGWVVKRRFDPKAPKGGAVVTWDEELIKIAIEFPLDWQRARHGDTLLSRADMYLIAPSGTGWDLVRFDDGKPRWFGLYDDGTGRYFEHYGRIHHPTPPGSWVGLFLRGTESRRRTDIHAIRYPDFDKEEPEVPEPKSQIVLVTQTRNRYATSLSNAAMGDLMNKIAWRARALAGGWGLAGKPTGKHTLQPHTGIRISRDLLYHKPTDKLFDVLADVEGEARPVWNEIENDGKLPWVAPVDPAGVSRGADWSVFHDGRAPVVVQGPELTLGVGDRYIWFDQISEVVGDSAVDGVLIPMMGAMPDDWLKALIVGNFTHNLVTWLWLVSETSDDGVPGREHATEVLNALIDFQLTVGEPGNRPKLIIEPTFDIWQAQGWDGEADVNSWLQESRLLADKRGVGGSMLFGARARLGLDTYGGDIALFESHIIDPDDTARIMLAEIAAAGGRPSGNSDRFRVRRAGLGKDWPADKLPHACAEARRLNHAICIGQQDERGDINRYGSGPFTYADGIRAALRGEEVPPVDPDEPTDPGEPPTGDSELERRIYALEQWARGFEG